MTKTKNDSTQIKESKHCELFKLVKTKSKKVVITAGEYRVSTKEFDTFAQADNYIGTKPYELILNSASLLIHLNNENNKKSSEETAKDN